MRLSDSDAAAGPRACAMREPSAASRDLELASPAPAAARGGLLPFGLTSRLEATGFAQRFNAESGPGHSASCVLCVYAAQQNGNAI